MTQSERSKRREAQLSTKARNTLAKLRAFVGHRSKLAKKVGCSNASVTSWIQGRTLPRPEFLDLIAKHIDSKELVR